MQLSKDSAWNDLRIIEEKSNIDLFKFEENTDNLLCLKPPHLQTETYRYFLQ
jgi:hypothetical protein